MDLCLIICSTSKLSAPAKAFVKTTELNPIETYCDHLISSFVVVSWSAVAPFWYAVVSFGLDVTSCSLEVDLNNS